MRYLEVLEMIGMVAHHVYLLDPCIFHLFD